MKLAFDDSGGSYGTGQPVARFLPLYYASREGGSGQTLVRWRIYKSELVDGRLTVAKVELDRKAAGLRSALLLSLCTAICPTATNPAHQMT